MTQAEDSAQEIPAKCSVGMKGKTRDAKQTAKGVKDQKNGRDGKSIDSHRASELFLLAQNRCTDGCTAERASLLKSRFNWQGKLNAHSVCSKKSGLEDLLTDQKNLRPYTAK